METNPLRPGGPIGVDAVLPRQFKAPSKPVIGIEAATQLVRDAIAQGALQCERLAVSSRPVHRGALLDMSGARVPFPAGEQYDRCYVALVDPDMDAQWAHPAHWAFIPAEGNGAVVLQDTSLAEHYKGAVRLFGMPLR
jgi:hypothetical protein